MQALPSAAAPAAVVTNGIAEGLNRVTVLDEDHAV